MNANVRSTVLAKGMFLTILVEMLLLVASVYGFSLWLHYPTPPAGQGSGTEPAIMLFSGVASLVVFVLIALRKAMDIACHVSSTSYQHRIDELQNRLNSQDDFFRLITDESPTTLSVFTNDNKYWFVNATAARDLQRSGQDLLGKGPAEILGPDRGRRVERCLDQVRQSGKSIELLNQELGPDQRLRYLQTRFTAIAKFGEFPGGVMMRDDNVTMIIVERQRRENMLRQIISTLVAVVDRRDPYASGHSSRVGQLSRSIGFEMQLAERDIEAAEIAGSLMNFGKVLVSRSILTKTDSLTPDELQRIRDAILTSADILTLIDFNAPVVPTLRQALERYDGHGVPNGIKGDSILITARVVAVANAFVALVSPRAYRPGIDLAAAITQISKESGAAFDPQVLAALAAYVEKNATRLGWLTSVKGS